MTSTAIYIENLDKSCVYLVTYSGDKLPPKFKDSTITPNKYIGSGFVEKIFDGYRGSVESQRYKKIWKQELKENPHLFHLEIISFHDNRQAAFDEEELIQREMSVVKSEEYVNLCYANGNFCNLECSEEHRKNISESLKGKPGRVTTEETKRKISARKTGRPRSSPSIETKRRMGLSKEGNTYGARPTIFNGVLYSSLGEAVDASGLSKYKFKKEFMRTHKFK
jgi:hypothetical protein